MAVQLLALVVRPRGTFIRVSGECHSILLYSQSVPDKLTMCRTTHHGRTLGDHVASGSRRFPEAVFGPLPHLYPFIVNDPGEGSQAAHHRAAQRRLALCQQLLR